MPKFVVTLKPMAADQVMTACSSVLQAAGEGLKMDWAYVDDDTHQPLCCWDAPDRAAIEDLFKRAEQETESIRNVKVFKSPTG